MKRRAVLWLLVAAGCAGPHGEAPRAAPTTAPGGAASVASAAASPAPAAGLPDLKGRKVLIGTDATYPPFESVDARSNVIVGFDVDLMAAIAKLIHIEPEFKNADFKTIFAALEARQFDAVMSASTITEERKKIVAFSDPYIEVGQLVVARKGSEKVRGYQDLAAGLRVGVQTGTTGEEAARREAKVADDKLLRYDTIDLAFADLANGSIDAVVADEPAVMNYASQPQYRDKLAVVGQPFTSESYGIAVSQKDPELLAAINAALAVLRADGSIARLAESHRIR